MTFCVDISFDRKLIEMELKEREMTFFFLVGICFALISKSDWNAIQTATWASFHLIVSLSSSFDVFVISHIGCARLKRAHTAMRLRRLPSQQKRKERERERGRFPWKRRLHVRLALASTYRFHFRPLEISLFYFRIAFWFNQITSTSTSARTRHTRARDGRRIRARSARFFSLVLFTNKNSNGFGSVKC